MPGPEPPHALPRYPSTELDGDSGDDQRGCGDEQRVDQEDAARKCNSGKGEANNGRAAPGRGNSEGRRGKCAAAEERLERIPFDARDADGPLAEKVGDDLGA